MISPGTGVLLQGDAVHSLLLMSFEATHILYRSARESLGLNV